MHVYSRMALVDREISNIAIPENYRDNAPLKHHQLDFDYPNLVAYQMKAIHTDGLHIQDIHIKSFAKLAINFCTTGQHVRFFFYFKGHTTVENGAGHESYKHDAGMLQRNFLDEHGGDGVVHLKADDETQHIILNMSRDFYIQLLRGESWINDDPFHQYILTGKPENRPNEMFFMDRNMRAVLQEIRSCQSIANNRYHFVKLKLRELLFNIHQLSNFGTNQEDQLITPKETLEKVRGYLLAHLENPPNIKSLAKIFLLNEKRLGKEFKLAYKHTIYAFVIQERMHKAKKLLLEDYNVNELALQLGYQSVSHFIKVFKAYHGLTPKEALKKGNTWM